MSVKGTCRKGFNGLSDNASAGTFFGRSPRAAMQCGPAGRAPHRPSLADGRQGGAWRCGSGAACEADIPLLVGLLLEDAARRLARDPVLWKIAGDARSRVEQALSTTVLGKGHGPRHAWLVAEAGGELVGAAHSLRFAVPPIYAGRWRGRGQRSRPAGSRLSPVMTRSCRARRAFRTPACSTPPSPGAAGRRMRERCRPGLITAPAGSPSFPCRCG